MTLESLKVGDVTVEVIRKEIKNIHLSVYPPKGRVRIAAPSRMKLDTIRVFAISKLGWIRQQQEKLLGQERESAREYLDRETHYLWGKRYLLKLVPMDAPAKVEIKHRTLNLHVRPRTGLEAKRELVEEWYRAQLKAAIDPLIAKWATILGVKVGKVFVQRMKTKWGSCQPTSRNLRFNTELAKKPRECLEYLVVHEMLHLLEPTHNARFISLMDQFLPKWQHRRQQLNKLPVHHEDWVY
jgi:hypothetical protein